MILLNDKTAKIAAHLDVGRRSSCAISSPSRCYFARCSPRVVSPIQVLFPLLASSFIQRLVRTQYFRSVVAFTTRSLLTRKCWDATDCHGALGSTVLSALPIRRRTSF